MAPPVRQYESVLHSVERILSVPTSFPSGKHRACAAYARCFLYVRLLPGPDPKGEQIAILVGNGEMAPGRNTFGAGCVTASDPTGSRFDPQGSFKEGQRRRPAPDPASGLLMRAARHEVTSSVIAAKRNWDFEL